MPEAPVRDSYTEMVQVVLPNDANPLGFILGGTVMHLIDIAGAIACHRHTRSLLVTAAVDGLQFLHPIKVGDLIILRARVTATFTTSLEVEVEVFSEGTLTGERQLTSVAYLTFVAIDHDGARRAGPAAAARDRRGPTEGARSRSARRAARLEATKQAQSDARASTPRPSLSSQVRRSRTRRTAWSRALLEDQPGALARRLDVLAQVDAVDRPPDLPRGRRPPRVVRQRRVAMEVRRAGRGTPSRAASGSARRTTRSMSASSAST